jgi:predicted transposase YdaD
MTSPAHDTLFKAVFSQPEHAEGELRFVLPPALAARIDFGTLVRVPGSFVEEEKLQQSFTDLLFTAKLGGHEAFLYILFEHQSTNDPLMAFRLLRYMVRIWETYLKDHPNARRLPMVIPVVLHHGLSGWKPDATFASLYDAPPEVLAAAGEYAANFRFALDDLHEVTDEELRSRAMSALARLALGCMLHARSPDELLDRLRGWADLVHEVRRAPNGGGAIVAVWQYIMRVSGNHRGQETLSRVLATVGHDREARAEVMSAAEDFIEQGRQEGLQEGRLERHRKVLLRMLRLRFGELPETVVSSIATATDEALDRWTDRVLTASTPDEVIREG